MTSFARNPEEMVRTADAIVLIRNEQVFGRSDAGKLVDDPEMRTGFGAKHGVYAICRVTAVLYGAEQGVAVGDTHEITLWRAGIITLKHAYSRQGEESIQFLRRGEQGLQPLYSEAGTLPLHWLEEVQAWIVQHKTPAPSAN